LFLQELEKYDTSISMSVLHDLNSKIV
jgi:hypothetical protein